MSLSLKSSHWNWNMLISVVMFLQLTFGMFFIGAVRNANVSSPSASNSSVFQFQEQGNETESLVHNGTTNIIRFNKNGTLKILNIADTHFGEYPHLDEGQQQDVNSTRTIRFLLNTERPDFVVFTGDQVTADFMYPNVSDYIDMLLEPLVNGNYKWASVYGNHDVGPNVSRLEILATEQKYTDLCFTKRGSPDLPGVTNYYLPVYPPLILNKSENEKPAMIWWFFDSQGGRDTNGPIPYVVDEKVVTWFRTEHRKLVETWGNITGLAFFHIPIKEYEIVQKEIGNHPECSGLVDDTVTPQDRDTGLLDALIEAGTIRTTFVGHTHGNSWCCYYRSLQLCYNRHTGYGGYGNWTRGARVIELDYYRLEENPKNYVRLENGSIIDHFPVTTDELRFRS